MVVTWGEPLLTTEPTILDISWEECLQKCWSDGRCVMIYDNTSTCEYHSIQQVTTVQKLSENNNSRVAFRVPYSVNETCEGSDNESILRSGTVQSFYQGAVQMFPYEVTLQNDIWKFTPEFSCEFPSSPVQRGNVTVCMEVVHTTECINRTEAAAKCGNLGIPDSLMGIASKEENQYLRSISTNYVSKQKTPTYYTVIGIWVDGVRKSTCKYPAGKSTSCNGYNEFDFSDPTAPDPQFDWLPNQPDALTAYEAESNCLYLRFGSEAYVAIGDTQCTDVVFPSIDMCYSGYLCGSDATVCNTSNQYRMVVTWGEPLETSGSTTLDISWVDCVQKCWNDEQCVLVHDTFPTCEYYSIQQVTTVQKLPETSDSRVAFRVLYSNEATCTDAENEPALNSGTVIGSTVDDGAYNITLENDVWTFQRELKCLFPSKAFQRENIKVCMTIVQTPTCITRTEAEESCSSFGIPGTLMGIYSSDETLYLKNMSSTMLNEQKTSITYERVGIWIDGLRKSTCKSPAPNCNGYNEFDFFDPSASNPSLSWRSGQPDGLTTGAPNSDCLFMRFGEGDEFGVGDMPCTEPTFPSLNMCYSGYLCGSFPS